MKKFKSLRYAETPVLIEGACLRNNEIWINVEYLWSITKDEDKFIKRFSKAYQHEFMHHLLFTEDKYMKGEEKYIRKYVDKEKWSKELEDFYNADIQKSLPKWRHSKRKSK